MKWIIFNGEFAEEKERILLSSNRSFRYGEGLFETMRVNEDKIFLLPFHYDRLIAGCQVLGIPFSQEMDLDWFRKQVLSVTRKNEFSHARVRFTCWAGDGDIKGNRTFNFLIESSPLASPVYEWNTDGLHIGYAADIIKSTDLLSNLKTTSFLPYVMAARQAEINRWDESFLLNSKGNIADCSIANIFLVMQEKIFTPPLSDGPVAGVTRRFLLEKFGKEFTIIERSLSLSDLQNADEVFCTNAIRGIRWVARFREKRYVHTFTRQLFDRFNAIAGDKG